MRPLAGRQQLIDQRLGEVQTGVRTDIDRLSQLVQQLGRGDLRAVRAGRSVAAGPRRDHPDAVEHHQQPARGVGQLERSWPVGRADGRGRACAWPGSTRASTTASARPSRARAGASPTSRSCCPKGHVLFMDVKFPMAAYLSYLDASTEAERSAHRATFVRDVRARVRELAKREYASTDDRPAVDNVLLFVPNETLSAFIHESDDGLIDEAMRPERRHLLAADPVRVPRASSARRSTTSSSSRPARRSCSCSASSASSGASTPTRSTRSSASSTRSTARSTSWPPPAGGRWNGR